MKKNATVRAMDHESAHRISAHQAVADLATAVKELIENALDAGASTVDIRLTNHGLDEICVADDGAGIAPSDHARVATKSATSKLTDFDDLDAAMAGRSLGFRGEALAALCALSSSLTVTTRARGGAMPVAMKLEFDAMGKLTRSQPAPMAGGSGTLVAVTGLFSALPVRAAEFKAHARREYARAVTVVQQYAVYARSARVSLTHTTAQGKKSLVLATPPVVADPGTIKSFTTNLASVFDSAAIAHWREIAYEHTDGGATSIAGGMVVHPTARATADRQFMFVNGRPVDMPRLAKMVTTLFRDLYPSVSTSSAQFPTFVLDVRVPEGMVDVNVMPDKRTAMLVDETGILAGFKTYLSSTLLTTQQTSVSASAKPLTSAPLDPPPPTPLLLSSQDSSLHATPSQHQPLRRSATPATHPTIATPASLRLQRRLAALAQVSPTPTPQMRRQREVASPGARQPTLDSSTRSAAIAAGSMMAPRRSVSMPTTTTGRTGADDDRDCDDGHDSSCSGHCSHSHIHHGGFSPFTAVPTRTPAADEIEGDNVAAANAALADEHLAPDAAVSQSMMHRRAFAQMRVVGQFNRGFIVAAAAAMTASDDGRRDLFLIDQHAADEKATYERLMRAHVPTVQPLVHPVRADVPPDLAWVLDGEMPDPRVRRAGFVIRRRLQRSRFLSETATTVDDEDDSGTADGWELTGVPLDARGRPMGPDDLLDLLVRCRDSPLPASLDGSQQELPPLVVTARDRAALASRACRSSVMIGMPLDKPRMAKIVAKLSDLEHPWVRLFAFPFLI
ncbi:hypothetical protein BC828DRAFT_390089 [Blastocladiella britannica]|nr:hypothetical protein BC828DRAFT_390089 [Blastocladiella britannica]